MCTSRGRSRHHAGHNRSPKIRHHRCLFQPPTATSRVGMAREQLIEAHEAGHLALLDDRDAPISLHIPAAAPMFLKGHSTFHQLIALDRRKIRKAGTFTFFLVTTCSTAITRRDPTNRLRKNPNRPPTTSNFSAFRLRVRYLELRAANLERGWIYGPSDRNPGTVGASPEPLICSHRWSREANQCKQGNGSS